MSTPSSAVSTPASTPARTPARTLARPKMSEAERTAWLQRRRTQKIAKLKEQLIQADRLPLDASKEIRDGALRLRQDNPGKYGRVGAKKGEAGHVANGWRQAILDSSEQYRRHYNPERKKRLVDLSDAQKQIRRRFLYEKRALEGQFYAELGSGFERFASEKAKRAFDTKLRRVGAESPHYGTAVSRKSKSGKTQTGVKYGEQEFYSFPKMSRSFGVGTD